jgi:hypothetical protein
MTVRQRALDVAIAEINKKTDLNLEIGSLEKENNRRITGLNIAIKTQTISNVGRESQNAKILADRRQDAGIQ